MRSHAIRYVWLVEVVRDAGDHTDPVGIFTEWELARGYTLTHPGHVYVLTQFELNSHEGPMDEQ